MCSPSGNAAGRRLLMPKRENLKKLTQKHAPSKGVLRYVLRAHTKSASGHGSDCPCWNALREGKIRVSCAVKLMLWKNIFFVCKVLGDNAFRKSLVVSREKIPPKSV